MRRSGKRAAVLAGVTALVAVLVLALAYQDDLPFRYHSWRLRLDDSHLMRAIAAPPDGPARRAVKEYVRRTPLDPAHPHLNSS